MDVLTNQQTKSYSYISRYAKFPFAYNKLDDKYVYFVTSQLKTNIQYVAHNIKQYDTLESLSLKYYGRPDYYWIIADFNRIQDPFISLYDTMQVIKIPTLSNIELIFVDDSIHLFVVFLDFIPRKYPKYY